jgi:hypothetical protein
MLLPLKAIGISTLSLTSKIFMLNIKKTVPALCSSLIVAPIAYSIDRSIVESTKKSTSLKVEFIETITSVERLKSPESIVTFLGLFAMFLATNIITKKINKIALCFFILTPFGISKDIRLASPIGNTKILKRHPKVYIGFMFREIISLISALIFPSNINIIVHYFYMLLLQIPQTYFHQIGLEYCSNNEKKIIIRENFKMNVFMRSVKNLIQYGIGLKLNLFFVLLAKNL